MNTHWRSALFTVVLLCVLSHAEYYVSLNEGVESSTDCSVGTPCVSITQAFSVFTAQSATTFDVFFAPGEYSGSNNLGIEYTVPSSFQPWTDKGSGPVAFVNLDNTFTTCFTANNDLTLINVVIIGCQTAIFSDSAISSSTFSLSNVTISSVTAINITATMQQLNINTNSVIIGNIYCNKTQTTTITNTLFTSNDTQVEINLRSSNMSVTNSVFQEVSHIDFYVVDLNLAKTEFTFSNPNFYALSVDIGSVYDYYGNMIAGNISIIDVNVRSSVASNLAALVISEIDVYMNNVNITGPFESALSLQTMNISRLYNCYFDVQMAASGYGINIAVNEALVMDNFTISNVAQSALYFEPYGANVNIKGYEISNGNFIGANVGIDMRSVTHYKGSTNFIKNVSFTNITSNRFISVSNGYWELSNIDISTSGQNMTDYTFIYFMGADVVISNSTFSDLDYSNAAIFAQQSDLKVTNCSFVNNRFHVSENTIINGAGAFIGASADNVVVFVDCQFINNTADAPYALLNIDMKISDVKKDFIGMQMNNCYFDSNQITDIILLSESKAEIINTTFINNLNTIFLDSTVANVSDCSFLNNYGSTIYGDSPVSVDGCIFENNFGALVNVTAGATMNNCRFNNNGCITNGASISATDTLNIINSIFTNNYMDGNGAIIYYFYPSTENVTIENCSFVNNTAGSGSVILIGPGDLSAYATIVNILSSNFTENVASNVVELNYPATVGDLVFDGNTGHAIDCQTQPNAPIASLVTYVDGESISIDGSTDDITDTNNGVSSTCFVPDSVPTNDSAKHRGIFIILIGLSILVLLCAAIGVPLFLFIRRRKQTLSHDDEDFLLGTSEEII